MRCAACFTEIEPAVIEVAGAACQTCGATFDAGAPPRAGASDRPPIQLVDRADGGAGGPCPRCATPLVASPLGDGACTLLACESCGGAFVDVEGLAWAEGHPTELPRADATASPAHASPSLDKYVACPRCRTLMSRRVFGKRSGVVVDVCAAHGTWFDAGELERGASFLASGGLARVARSEAEERRDRARDPRVVRAQAEAQAALAGEAAREGRELGRWEGRWETRWHARDVRAAGGFLAWLRSLLD